MFTYHYDGDVVNNVDEIDIKNVVVHTKEDVVISDDFEEPRVPVRKTYNLVEYWLKNMCKKKTSYEAFKSQITTNVFRWRCYSSVDIIGMNDYMIWILVNC